MKSIDSPYRGDDQARSAHVNALSPIGLRAIKRRGKTHSEETIGKLKEHAKNRNYVPVPGIKVEVTDLLNNQTTIYNSVREAARALSTNMSSLLSRENRGTVASYKGRYIVNIRRS